MSTLEPRGDRAGDAVFLDAGRALATITAPADGVDGWTFGIPSIWAWQILFWLLGVFMMWLLAYKMEMSTVPDSEIEALVEDIGDVAPAQESR